VAISWGTKSTKGGSKSLKGICAAGAGGAAVLVGVARRKLWAGAGVRSLRGGTPTVLTVVGKVAKEKGTPATVVGRVNGLGVVVVLPSERLGTGLKGAAVDVRSVEEITPPAGDCGSSRL